MRMKWPGETGKSVILALVLSLSVGAPASAHPHMSLSARLEFEFSGRACVGFWQEWTLDPLFSASIIAEQDGDKNGRLEGDEILEVESNAFSNLYRFGYFTLIRTGPARTNPKRVERFDARIAKGSLVYRFYVRLPEPLVRDFSVAVFDTTFFCAVRYPADAVIFRQTQPGIPAPAWSKSVNRDFPVYYDPLQPAGNTTVHTKPGPGLVTAYPEEINVSLSR